MIGIAAVIAVLAGLVLGFLAIGPPSAARRTLFDEERVRDLRIIAATINEQYAETHTLPRRNEVAVSFRADGSSGWNDPETGTPFDYTAADGRHYILCAIFSGPSDADETLDRWRHGAGRACFTLDASAQDIMRVTGASYAVPITGGRRR